MTSASAHIVPKNRNWIVFNPGGRRAGAFTTQREAISKAAGLICGAKAGQIVVHTTDGSYRIVSRKGLPIYAASRSRSSLGKTAIKKAVSSVVRTRLLGE